MNGCFRIVLVALGLCCAAVPAEAKSIHVGEFSRNSIRVNCERAGGRAYGIDDESQQYGCSSSHTGVVVVCSVDSDCFAIVDDMAPITGNSLDLLLRTRRSGQPRRIEAVNSKIH